jgi:hypothetical protein
VSAARVVHVLREPYDIYIGRPNRWFRLPGSRWANPFKIGVGVDESRQEAVKKYREWIQEQPGLLADIPSLKGKILACWCAPKLCHGDVLSKLADQS